MMQNCVKLLQITLKCNQRNVSTSAALYGKRNFRKFLTYNKRGTRVVKQMQSSMLNPPVPIHKRGVRDIGHLIDGKFVEIPEKIPQLIVPDLTDCKLKPYVSYKAPEVTQSEFTSLDLFNAMYAQKIIDDWKTGKLNEDGSPKEPSDNEQLTAEAAFKAARKTGSDIF